jgi:glycosyltransferase involved in cell wall biosynthesis
MKILHINRDESEGGAARAAMRICNAQRRLGMNSEMLVQNKTSDSSYVVAIEDDGFLSNSRKTFISRRLMSLQRTPGNKTLHSINIFNNAAIVDYINNSDADIINIHWVCWEMLSIKDIGAIKKKIIWTLHDMWPFSGAEHYDDDIFPGRYANKYSKKTKLSNSVGFDIDRFVWERKIKNWSKLDLIFAAPSRWMAKCAENSIIGKNSRVRVVPNCIDMNIFHPMEVSSIREEFGIPSTNIVLLFGAMSSTSDRRKGFHLIQGAFEILLKRINYRDRITILIYGGESDIKIPGFSVKSFGFVEDDLLLAKLYNSANLMLVPSVQENLSNAIMESLACGTPVCCFNIGGNSDMVVDGYTGYLCEKVNSEAYAEAILRGIGGENVSILKNNCVNHIRSNFSEEVVVDKYAEIYNESLQGEL